MSEVIFVFSTVAAIMALGFLGDALSRKVLVPSVIMLMILGIIFGPILNLFPYDSLMAAVPIIAPLTLAFIGLEAGMSMDIHKVVGQSVRAIIISILGFSLSMTAVGSLLHFALGIRWAYALLMASAWSGINIAIVNAVFRYIKPQEETRVTFTIVSLVDDPIVLISTLTILNYILLGNLDSGGILIGLTSNIGISLVIGFILGLAWLNVLYFLRKGEYTYTFTLAAFLFVYALSEILGGTGVISIFLFGLVLGNYKLIVKRFKLKMYVDEFSQLKNMIEKFHSEITFMLRCFFFTFIGLIYVFTGVFALLLALACSLVLHLTKYAVAKIGTYKSTMSSDLPAIGLIVGQGAASASMSTLPLVHNLTGATILTSLALNIILLNNITSILLPFLATKFTRKNRPRRV